MLESRNILTSVVMPPTKIRFGIVVPNLGGFKGGIIEGGVIVVVVVVKEGVLDDEDAVEEPLP